MGRLGLKIGIWCVVIFGIAWLFTNFPTETLLVGAGLLLGYWAWQIINVKDY